jgi:hypothetical protein
MKFIYYLAVLSLVILSCGKQEDNPQPAIHNIKFSVASPNSSGGRTNSTDVPKSIVVSIKDYDGTIKVDHREIVLSKIGDRYFTEPISIESTIDNSYYLSEYLVLNEEGTVIFVTPKEGSELAHLVNDPLDIAFSITEEEVTTVVPEVVRIEADADPIKYGYAQFGFNVVKTLSVVFSPFARIGSSIQLTEASLVIVGLNANSEPAWTYEVNLAAGANNFLLRQYPSYRLTAVKAGYGNWTRTVPIADKQKIEIVLDLANHWDYTELWSELYGGSKRDVSAKTIATSDGGVLIVGNTMSTDHDIDGYLGMIDAWILKLDGDGNVQWSTNYGTVDHDDFALAVTEYTDGSGFLVTGFSRLKPAPDVTKDGWLVKINTLGSVVWEREVGQIAYNFSTTALTGNSNFLLIGRYEADDATSILQVDGSGEEVWEKSSNDYPLYGGFKDIKTIGGAYLLSYNRSIYKMDAQGDVIWHTEKLFDDNADQRLPIFEGQGGYVVFGQSNNFNGKGLFGLMIRVGNDGAVVSIIAVTDPEDDQNEVLYDVAKTDNGNYLLIGTSGSLQNEIQSNFINEITPHGTTLRRRIVRDSGNTCGTPYPVYFRTVKIGDDYLITGGASTVCGNLPGAMGDFDVWISRIRL